MEMTEQRDVEVNHTMHGDLMAIAQENDHQITSTHEEGSFQQPF